MYIIDTSKLNYWQQIQQNTQDIQELQEESFFVTKRGNWSDSVQYNPNDLVSFKGSSYLAIVGNIGYQPDLSPEKWQLFAEHGISVISAKIEQI